MKTIVTSLALMLAVAAGAEEKTYQVGNFNRIDASCAVTVRYTVGEKCSVRAEGRAQDIERYEVKTKDDRLVIDIKSRLGKNVKIQKLVFYVTGPADVREVELSGASHFYTKSTLRGDGIKFDISGASHVECPLVIAPSVKVDCSGASHVTLGKVEAADEAEFDISGASHCQANVKGKTVDVDCSGASHTTLDVQCDDVKADASGVSRITLTGSAKFVVTDTSGMSKINCAAVTSTNVREQSANRKSLKQNKR